MPSRFNLRRVVRSAIGAVIASLMIASTVACATIPQSSEVRYRGDINNNLSSDYLYYSPAGPAKGMTQREILSGFINAATGPQNDYAVARQYLSTGAKTRWSPNTETLVQRGTAVTQLLLDNMANVQVGVQARVDSAGHYQVLPAGSSRTLQYTFVLQNGEWRISSAPDLTLLMRPVFDVIFHSYSVYFWSSGHTYLVPDVRWFPARSSTATRMVTALLNGPSDWLSVTTIDAPKGTELAIDSVPVLNDTAQVNLNQAFLSTSQSQRRYFLAQLSETLKQLPGLQKVQILVQNSPLDIAEMTLPESSFETTSPVVLINGALTQVDSTSDSSLRNAAGMLKSLLATDFAISRNRMMIAIKGAKGTWEASLGSLATSLKLIDSRPNLLSPVFDANNSVWTHTDNGDDSFVVTSAGGGATAVSSVWLKGLKIREFALSPEGARIAILAGTKGHYRVYLSAIQRDVFGVPVALHQPIELTRITRSPISLAWGSPNQVVVLYSQGADQPAQPVSYLIGGDFSQLAPANNARRVLASSTGAVYVLTNDGLLLENNAYTWLTRSNGVLAAHFAK